jgi:hypothetical protein
LKQSNHFFGIAANIFIPSLWHCLLYHEQRLVRLLSLETLS